MSSTLSDSRLHVPGRNAEDLTALHSAVVVVTGEWAIRRWNVAAERLFDIAHDDAVGRDLWEILPVLTGGEVESIIRDAAARSRERSLAMPGSGGEAQQMRLLPLGGGELSIEIGAQEAIGPAGPEGHAPGSRRLVVGSVLRGLSGGEAAMPSAALPADETPAGAPVDAGRDIAPALSDAATDPPAAFRLLSERTQEVTGAGGAMVALVVGRKLRVEGGAGSLAPFLGHVVPVERTICSHALDGMRTILADDVETDPRADTATIRMMGIRQALIVPLIVEGRPVGVLTAVNSRRGRFEAEDVERIEALGREGAPAVRTALLFNRVERSAREARALAEIVRNINQSLEVERVLALIARHAMDLLDARESRVATFEEGEILVMASRGDGDERWRVPADAAEAGQWMRRQPVERRSAVHVPWEHWRWPADMADAGTIAVRLDINDRPLGVIEVLGEASQTFSDDDEALLLALADHAAIAIENARLYRSSVRVMRHASILAAAARSFALHVPPDAMYEDVWRLARSSLDADGVGIYLMERCEEGAELTFASGIGSDLARANVGTFWRGSGGTVAHSGRAVFLHDVSGDASPLGPALAAAGVSSVALLPLMVEGKPRGILSLRFRAPQPFHADQQRLLLDFASHAALAVRNALLLADLEEQAAQLRAAADAERRQRQEAEAGAAIARIALRSHGVNSAAAQILSVLDAVAPSAASALAVRRDDGGLRYVGGLGAAARLIDQRVGEVFSSDRSTRVPELRVDESVSDVVLPLASGDRVIGLLAMAAGGDPSDESQRRAMLHRLAAPVSLALASLLLREEERRVAEQLRQSERLAALGELVAGVAHEVNNPLTGISAFAQLLQEESLTSDQLESARLIKKEADRAAAVMRDLLTFARKTGPRLVAVDLNQLIHQTLRLRSYGLRSMGIDVHLELTPSLPRVRGDDRQLQQVLMNLVINAEHAMVGGGVRTLTVCTFTNADAEAGIEVRDTGCGMSAEVQRRVFEPFFTTKPDGRGTGLGLSVSHGIILNHQGRVEVESTPGVGTTFRVFFPALRPHEPPETVISP